MAILTIVNCGRSAQTLPINFIKIVMGRKGKRFEGKRYLIKKTLKNCRLMRRINICYFAVIVLDLYSPKSKGNCRKAKPAAKLKDRSIKGS